MKAKQRNSRKYKFGSIETNIIIMIRDFSILSYEFSTKTL